MVVCKFFLQGTCKFGNSCKFEHQINDTTNTQSTSVRQNVAGSGVPDVNTLVRSVQTDMNNTEKGGQWLLSSYAPYKEKAAFPGFEDKSFEEVRLGFYDANKNGSVEQYKQQLQSYYQEAIMKIRALQNPTPDIVNLLKQLYNTPVKTVTNGIQNPASTFSGNGNVFGNSTGNSIFNRPATAPTGFGNQSAFSNVSSPFVNQSGTQSVFGGQTAGQNIFGAQKLNENQSFTGGSLFQTKQAASATPFNSTFTNQNPTFASESSFGNSPLLTASQNNSPSTQLSPFAPSPFAKPGTQSVFNPQTPQVQNPFAQTSTPVPSPFSQSQPLSQARNPFAAAANTQPPPSFSQTNVVQSAFGHQASQPPTPFAQVSTQSPFAQLSQPTQPQSIFSQGASFGANQPQSTFVPQITMAQPSVFSGQSTMPSVFGGQPSSGVFKQNAPIDESLYSKNEELTQEELNAFQADHFEFGSIPQKPPPVQLCF